MKSTQLRLRVSPDELETLDEMCMAAFTRQSIASMLLSAAIHAVKENDGKMSFPPKFTVGIHESNPTTQTERYNKARR